ncbi:hypothetical protein Fcan01_10659 [Folsomia candida]|uniref:Uncharacterized protein n=1 Tax=Folsomia candida TaxID=158441 RepID=A0A226ECE9_FOLCA|nr:hypothetical protein Fcan01_10659 [Folsomia candida]
MPAPQPPEAETVISNSSRKNLARVCKKFYLNILLRNRSELLVTIDEELFSLQVTNWVRRAYYTTNAEKKFKKFGAFQTVRHFADQIAFEAGSDYIQRNLHFLKGKYTSMTCNIVKEKYYEENIIFKFRYFGSEGFYRNLQSITSTGISLLYARLWKFVDERNIRLHPLPEQEGTGALENLFVAFQLYIAFISFPACTNTRLT